mmetsp:Transcript_38144/g.63304  ORF Transcript_38144/g.63304 Transcript_38144/m.63304 type:complete len:250 (+) Transcript_38144:38-787(+)
MKLFITAFPGAFTQAVKKKYVPSRLIKAQNCFRHVQQCRRSIMFIGKNTAPDFRMESRTQQAKVNPSWVSLGSVLGYGSLNVVAFEMSKAFHVDFTSYIQADDTDIFIGVLSFPVLLASVFATRSVQDELKKAGKLLKDLQISQMFLVALSAGWTEEFLCRGVLQPAFSDWWGWPSGLALSSVLFGLGHPLSPQYIVWTTLAGAYMGVICVLRHNILAPAIMHTLFDFIILSYYVSKARYDDDKPSVLN